MSIKAIDVRRGMAVNWKDGLWVIIENEKVAKGNWRSYQVVTLKNIKTGQQLKERFRTDEQFDQAILDRRPMEYLYSAGTSHIVMDPDSFEQVPLPAELLGDQSVYLAPNIQLMVAMVDAKPVSVELPNTVQLKVTDTPPGVRSATATNQLKEALCEGGAKVRVPAFVENGTVIVVDTRTGEYLSRA